MSQYFPKPFGRKIDVNVDLSNYATKTDLKNISHIDTSNFALKINLASLKTEVDKLDIDKLVPVPADLSKLSEVVKMTLLKNLCLINWKVDNIDTSDFVLKTNYNADKTKLEKKIVDSSGLVKKTDYNTKIAEIKSKVADITNLATKIALTTVENKIPDVSSLVKKTGYITKETEIENKLNYHNHDKYITTSDFNKLAKDVFNARLTQANLIIKTDLDAKFSRINREFTKYKSKILLIENELN